MLKLAKWTCLQFSDHSFIECEKKFAKKKQNRILRTVLKKLKIKKIKKLKINKMIWSEIRLKWNL